MTINNPMFPPEPPVDLGNVVRLAERPPAAEPAGRSPFSDIEETTLTMIAKWHAARGSYMVKSALFDAETRFGHVSACSVSFDDTDLDLMEGFAGYLGQAEPGTILSAREMLGVVIAIMAHAEVDERHPLSTGPVLAILRNVRNALLRCTGTELLVRRA